MANEYLGTQAYTLKNLFVTSNHYSTTFLDTFVDKSVSNSLSPGWPNNMSVSMSDYDANMLCLFSQWKVDKYQEEIKAMLTADDDY